MQTVWSRVAQTRVACKCASCAVKTSLSRQAASATGKRPTKFLTSSTLLYSGIFAVAATTDALVKERRRKQWDEAIAGAKEGLDALEERARGRRSQGLEQGEYLDELEASFRDGGQQDEAIAWPENTGQDFGQWVFAPQSIYASSKFRYEAAGARQSVKKLQLTSLAMDKLTLRILLRLDDQGQLKVSAREGFRDDFRVLLDKPKSQLERMLELVDVNIRATKVIKATEDETAFAPYKGILSQYSQDRQGHWVGASRDLDLQIQQMLIKFESGKMTRTDLILQALHSLTRSSAPPSLTCWNTLLRGLSANGFDRNITDRVVSAMRLSKARMNEQTLSTILTHWRQTGAYDRFCHWVQLMQGEHEGLMLAHPDTNITEASQGRLVRVTRYGTPRIIQKPVPTPMVFASLIQGVVHFEGFEAALSVCEAMGTQGWGLSMKGLTPLLQNCARRSDWASGLAVWTQIKHIQARSIRNSRAELIQPWTYASMLLLCERCDRDAEFVEVLEEAIHRKLYPRSLLKKAKRLLASFGEVGSEVDAVNEFSSVEFGKMIPGQADPEPEQESVTIRQVLSRLPHDEDQSEEFVEVLEDRQDRAADLQHTMSPREKDLSGLQELIEAADEETTTSKSKSPKRSRRTRLAASSDVGHLQDNYTTPRPALPQEEEAWGGLQALVEAVEEENAIRSMPKAPPRRRETGRTASAESTVLQRDNPDPDRTPVEQEEQWGGLHALMEAAKEERSSKSGSDAPSRPRQVRKPAGTDRSQIEREQLMGHSRASTDLDIYEFAERPMQQVHVGEEQVFA